MIYSPESRTHNLLGLASLRFSAQLRLPSFAKLAILKPIHFLGFSRLGLRSTTPLPYRAPTDRVAPRARSFRLISRQGKDAIHLFSRRAPLVPRYRSSTRYPGSRGRRSRDQTFRPGSRFASRRCSIQFGVLPPHGSKHLFAKGRTTRISYSAFPLGTRPSPGGSPGQFSLRSLMSRFPRFYVLSCRS